jgi:hypothetical protein
MEELTGDTTASFQRAASTDDLGRILFKALLCLHRSRRWRPECSTLRAMLCLPKLLLLSLAIGASAGTAIAQDPVIAFPKNYSFALDNDLVSVIRVHYGAHERIGVHDHSKFPTIYVYFSDSGSVLFEHDEKPPFRPTRPPTTIGAFRLSPGRIERHAVTNLSDTNSDSCASS